MSASRIRTGRARPPRRPPGVITLSDPFRAWIVENALQGIAPTRLIQTLIEAGVSARIAQREVAEILASPALAAARKLSRRVEQLEQLARLRRELDAHSEKRGELERRTSVSADDLYTHYFSAGRPLVLPGFAKDWPAKERWSPAYFKDCFGQVEIEIMAERAKDPHCDRNFEAHRRKIALSDYVDMLLSAGTTNDFYMVAHNNALHNPDLRPLLDDVIPPDEIFDPTIVRTAVSLWLGPAGTRTPLHHDTTNILFCQIWGRKRFWLVSPFETSLLSDAEGFYATFSAEEIEARDELGVRIHRVDLEPGDALFLPIGYWHEVLALEPSISFSLMGFRRPNDFDWYRPGCTNVR